MRTVERRKRSNCTRRSHVSLFWHVLRIKGQEDFVKLVLVLILSVFAVSAASAQTPQGTIAVRESDSVVNGAIIGAGVGVASGLFFCGLMEPWEACRDDYRAMLTVGAIGAGIGIAVDALIRKKVYQTASGVEVHTGAIVRRREKGVQLFVRF